MKLISYGVAVGIGYYLAQPSGQRQLTQLRHRVVELAQSPQATQLRERGRNSLGGRALAAWPVIASRPAAAKTDHASADPAQGDESSVESRPGAEALIPARGRRLRRQRVRENRRRRADPASPAGPETPGQPAGGSAGATSSPPADPTGLQAH